MTLSFASQALSQVDELREYRGETIACVQSGFFSFEMPCGLMNGFYPYIFIGTVTSSMETSNFEKTLQVMPEEVFAGDIKGPLTVKTSPSACLPEFEPGDRWLFYLRRDTKSGEPVLSYGDPSSPEKQASVEIERLRKLVRMSVAGKVIGAVTDRNPNGQADSPRASHKVTARNTSDGQEFEATTDAEGKFEFRSLPIGTYKVSANTVKGLWAEDGPIKIKPRGCSSIQFALQTDGRISGQILNPDGGPAGVLQVELIPESEDRLGSQSRFTDERGRCNFRGLAAGRYLIGINIDENVASSSPRGPSLFYPGVHERRNAIAVEITEAGEQTGVDFQLQEAKTQ
jgi:hypothetical protein